MGRILVVEDDVPTRTLLNLVFESLLDHEVRSADCVGEALAMLEEWVPDVLVTDVRLPDALGTALAGFVRDHPRYHGTEVLYLTAFPPPDVARGESVLTKPFELEELEEAVTDLLRRSAGQPASG